ncbi:hypothetical protein KGF56_000967 [Candida oxycetoniae]|uniref:Uncharacterized protein n=1 Tax=Candida oxycetoniae TaxID=497107 RepID=A0AAI9T0D5_9ASCO|nr:uncharacterized protein KGF56_000967 [Candida oxycetoniae]KAI3406125.2 hypothetical protein KGF56_000967 [Candida oxycetoniae]
MSNSLEERLKEHSSAFDGLLSLIPAKYFYDDATQDQWQQKKKGKEELKQNKRAKFNPESKNNADELVNSHASARDVMENNSRRALEEQSVNKHELDVKSKSKTDDGDGDGDGKKNVQSGAGTGAGVGTDNLPISESTMNGGVKKEEENDDGDILMNDDDNHLIFDDDGNEIENGSFLKESIRNNNNTKKPKARALSPEERKEKEEKLAKLREKLETKISNLRDKRKAIGSKAQGAPQSREQILAERKRRVELSKQQKRKHSELEEEEEENNEDEEEELSEFDNSDMEDTGGEHTDKSVIFGNIAFQDGSQVTSDLTRLRKSADKRKQKGPANNDIKAHLKKIEKKKQKLASMTLEDQEKQNQKDKWQKVISQAEGVKVKDDEKLLKKALKRKEKKKLKSEIEWRERKQIVKDTVAARAKRREENLKARKDSKRVKGSKKKSQQPKLRKFTGVGTNGFQLLNHFEKQTGLPRSYAVLAFVGFYFVLIFLNFGGIGQLLSNIAGFVVPGYYSILALQTATSKDDTQILTYWVVFAFLNVIEFWSKAILYWIPFYYLFKTIFLLYIGIPATGGAETIYNTVIKPIANQYVRPIDTNVTTNANAPHSYADTIHDTAEGVSTSVHI